MKIFHSMMKQFAEIDRALTLDKGAGRFVFIYSVVVLGVLIHWIRLADMIFGEL